MGSDEAMACFGDERHTESCGPTSQGEGTPRSRTGMRQPLSITEEPPSCFWASPSFGWSLLLFIPLFRSSSPYTCQSSIPILKCTSLQPFFLALCKLLWPPSPCPGVTSTSKGVRVLIVCIYMEVTAFLGAASPPIPLWLDYMAWNLFCDPRVDVLGRCGVFFSHDFGLLRTRSSSVVHSDSLDSLHSSPGTSSSSAWALSLRWNGPKPLGPSGPTIAPQNHATQLLKQEGRF